MQYFAPSIDTDIKLITEALPINNYIIPGNLDGRELAGGEGGKEEEDWWGVTSLRPYGRGRAYSQY